MSHDPHAKLRQLIEVADNGASTIFKNTGRLLPMWHAVTLDGRHVVLPAPPGCDSKDEAVAMVRDALAYIDAVIVVGISEAWAVYAKPDDAGAVLAARKAAEIGRVEDSPYRIEIINYMGEDAAGMLTGERRIIRPAKGKAQLGPLELREPWHNSAGRLVGMLPQRGTRQ